MEDVREALTPKMHLNLIWWELENHYGSLSRDYLQIQRFKKLNLAAVTLSILKG